MTPRTRRRFTWVGLKAEANVSEDYLESARPKMAGAGADMGAANGTGYGHQSHSGNHRVTVDSGRTISGKRRGGAVRFKEKMEEKRMEGTSRRIRSSTKGAAWPLGTRWLPDTTGNGPARGRALTGAPE